MTLTRSATSRWQRALASLLATVGLLAACGGGSSQYDPFVAQRLFAFGDETSTLTATPAGNGRKYSVNGLDADGNVDCRLEPIWVQYVAFLYGFVFAECNPDMVAEPQARMYAALAAKVADVAVQVETAQAQSGGLRDKDLATVMAGANDILEIYGLYPAQAEAVLLAEARARGERLAQVVNRLVDLGAKVVVSDLPDIGLTPFAAQEKALYTDTDRAALLTRLSTAFNEQLGVKVLLDGRFVGLVQADLQFRAASLFPASFGLVNATAAVCTVALPDCRSDTLLTDAVASQYLWADATRIGSGGHLRLGTLAVDRARRNPF
ncbi:MAG: SGNH/GDSL hydrolase family protein [Rubrivivax sp.]|nr:SGNH/GDSL hydrolase family protein [Rubrivivax sp.]